jgi:hypothetical protein
MTDLSEDVVTTRLERMAEACAAASGDGTASMRRRAREAQRTAVVDMSPEAIDSRLRRMSGMRRLCLELGEAGLRGA